MFFNQITEIQPSASSVNPDSIKLRDIDFCNLLTAYMGALPFLMSRTYYSNVIQHSKVQNQRTIWNSFQVP